MDFLLNLFLFSLLLLFFGGTNSSAERRPAEPDIRQQEQIIDQVSLYLAFLESGRLNRTVFDQGIKMLTTTAVPSYAVSFFPSPINCCHPSYAVNHSHPPSTAVTFRHSMSLLSLVWLHFQGKKVQKVFGNKNQSTLTPF